VVASISLFESRAEAEQSTQRAADWGWQHVAALLPQPLVVKAGEVVLHGTP
jgi:hypothetical protein